MFPYGVHLAVVRVDRDTGKIAVERFMVAYDVGRAVNPMLIEGQLVGGCVQGLGGALSEEFVYDETGEPLSATFADYLMPTLHEVPDVEVLLTEDAPSPRHPLGLKGAGEGGINGAGGVIASRDRRRAADAGRDHAAAGDAAADQGVVAQARYGLIATRVSSTMSFGVA